MVPDGVEAPPGAPPPTAGGETPAVFAAALAAGAGPGAGLLPSVPPGFAPPPPAGGGGGSPGGGPFGAPPPVPVGVGGGGGGPLGGPLAGPPPAVAFAGPGGGLAPFGGGPLPVPGEESPELVAAKMALLARATRADHAVPLRAWPPKQHTARTQMQSSLKRASSFSSSRMASKPTLKSADAYASSLSVASRLISCRSAFAGFEPQSRAASHFRDRIRESAIRRVGKWTTRGSVPQDTGSNHLQQRRQPRRTSIVLWRQLPSRGTSNNCNSSALHAAHTSEIGRAHV